MPRSSGEDGRIDLTRDAAGGIEIRVRGPFTLREGVPPAEAAATLFASAPAGTRVAFECRELGPWDSSLVTVVAELGAEARGHGLVVDESGLPEGVRRLVGLARAVPPREGVRIAETPYDDALTARVGRVALRASATASDATTFLGEAVLALVAFLRGRARYRRADLLHAFEASGVAALGIVALINFLIGAVLAFVGAVQLQQFGATLYVASLVAIGMTRELGPLMTGIVMAGRTGASFAAVLGTMTVNEEVDALVTTGLRPVEFLVVPRVLATTLMMPALVAYADLLGLLGGMFVGVSVLDLGAMEYLRLSRDSLPLRHVFIGLAKSLAFGAVVALTGCYYGMRCGRSAASVGEAATRAVVVGIVLVVVVDAVFTLLLHAARL